MNTSRILRLPQVKQRTGLAKTSIYLAISNNTFPKQISLGNKSVGWLESSIEEWIENRIAESRDGGENAA